MTVTELVLVVSDMFIPLRCSGINEQFKSMLIPNKIQYVLSLGNIGCRESYDWLKGLSQNFHAVRGDYDEENYPEKSVVQIGNFKIGMIHGHQIIPTNDFELLSNVQRELDCDILLYGNTHQLSVKTKDNCIYINPGSISGAVSSNMENNNPSFILMMLQGDEVTIYSYVLKDKNKKFVVGQIEYVRGEEEFKVVQSIEDENNNDEKNQSNENNENVENNQEVKQEENKEGGTQENQQENQQEIQTEPTAVNNADEKLEE